MSHMWARRLTYVLGLLLLSAVALFAWGQGGEGVKGTCFQNDTAPCEVNFDVPYERL